jgi:hypothetical protein
VARAAKLELDDPRIEQGPHLLLATDVLDGDAEQPVEGLVVDLDPFATWLLCLNALADRSLGISVSLPP